MSQLGQRGGIVADGVQEFPVPVRIVEAGAPEVRRRGHVESSSQVLVRGLLLGSDRLTLISRRQVQFEIDVGRLVALDFDMGETLREIGLTFRSGWVPTAVQLDFLQTLRGVARRHSEG